MSFSVTWNVSGRIDVRRAFAKLLGAEGADVDAIIASALTEGEIAAFEAMIADIPVGETENLLSSAKHGRNQSSFYIAVASAPAGDGKQYGTYQNYGYHTRSGVWVPGHHFLETGMAAGAAVVNEMMGFGNLATGFSGVADKFGSGGFGVMGTGTFSGFRPTRSRMT